MSGSSHLAGRTLARAQALQLLFQAEVRDRALEEVLSGPYALSQGPLEPYGEHLARGVSDHLSALDRVLTHATRNWSLARVSIVERNLMRIALYEMLYVDEVATAVAISECVVLAKLFGSTDDSSKFVNGVLGRIAAEIEHGTDVVERARVQDAGETAGYEHPAQSDARPDEPSSAWGVL